MGTETFSSLTKWLLDEQSSELKGQGEKHSSFIISHYLIHYLSSHKIVFHFSSTFKIQMKG